MPDNERPRNYETYLNDLWGQLEQSAEPRTLSRIVAAEACFLQVPDEEAATARPDLDEIDGWAERIEGTKAFERVLDSPKLQERIAGRDAEGLMTELYGELTARTRGKSAEPERERAAEKRMHEREAPEKKAPEGPAL